MTTMMMMMLTLITRMTLATMIVTRKTLLTYGWTKKPHTHLFHSYGVNNNKYVIKHWF